MGGDEQDLLAVYSWVVARLEVKDCRLDPLLLPFTRLTLPVEIPDWLCKQFRDIGMVLLEIVPDRVATDLFKTLLVFEILKLRKKGNRKNLQDRSHPPPTP